MYRKNLWKLSNHVWQLGDIIELWICTLFLRFNQMNKSQNIWSESNNISIEQKLPIYDSWGKITNIKKKLLSV